MKTTYFEADGTLVLHLSDKPIVREVADAWLVNGVRSTRRDQI